MRPECFNFLEWKWGSSKCRNCEFVWNDGLIGHLGEQGVSQNDLEQVVYNPWSKAYSRVEHRWLFTSELRLPLPIEGYLRLLYSRSESFSHAPADGSEKGLSHAAGYQADR